MFLNWSRNKAINLYSGAPAAKIEFAFSAPTTVKNLEDSSGYAGINWIVEREFYQSFIPVSHEN